MLYKNLPCITERKLLIFKIMQNSRLNNATKI